MEHSTWLEFANREIRNNYDFASAIHVAVAQALDQFDHERKSPLETKIDYASTKIVCGYSMERDSYVIKITAHNWERNNKPVEDGEQLAEV